MASRKQFRLSVIELNTSEVAIKGNGFAILVWLDRDGVTMKYVDLENSGEIAVIDIGSYLATKRTWIVENSTASTERFDSQITRAVLSYARTLQEQAPDILQGKKDWLKDVQDRPLRLSEHHASAIRSLLTLN